MSESNAMDVNEAVTLVKEVMEDFDGSESFFHMGPKTQARWRTDDWQR